MTLRDVETGISKLPPKQLAVFRAWFYKFEGRVWDRRFEQDVKGGKLDRAAERAVEDYKKGRCKPL